MCVGRPWLLSFWFGGVWEFSQRPPCVCVLGTFMPPTARNELWRLVLVTALPTSRGVVQDLRGGPIMVRNPMGSSAVVKGHDEGRWTMTRTSTINT